MTADKLKALLPLLTECVECGFCANTPPSAAEIREIITELIKYKEEETMDIRIKYHDSELPKITNIKNKSDWLDLRAAEETVMLKGEYALIPLGVSMAIPEGYEAHIVPRSSTFKNYGILQANGIGIIDNSYSGTNDMWYFPAYATRDIVIHKGDRICQFRVFKNQPPISFHEMDKLNDIDRGGIGSTGVR